MAQHTIPITNGVGSLSLVDGSYSVSSNTIGYDNDSILPSTQEITSDTNEYAFTIGATGTLTLHVTDDGTESGVEIIGAIFYRCDASGTKYGDPIESNSDGDAIFNNVPFDADNAPNIYYVQTASDGEHSFIDSVQSTTLTASTGTINIANPEAPERTIKLTDANYDNLPIEDGEVILS